MERLETSVVIFFSLTGTILPKICGEDPCPCKLSKFAQTLALCTCACWNDPYQVLWERSFSLQYIRMFVCPGCMSLLSRCEKDLVRMLAGVIKSQMRQRSNSRFVCAGKIPIYIYILCSCWGKNSLAVFQRKDPRGLAKGRSLRCVLEERSSYVHPACPHVKSVHDVGRRQPFGKDPMIIVVEGQTPCYYYEERSSHVGICSVYA